MSEETRGQQSRKMIRQQIESELRKYCPNQINKLADLIAYDFNLSPYTVRYTYLPMFLTVGILEFDHDNMVVLSAKGQKLQTTDDGLTEEQLKEEFEEENEQRKTMGKPEISYEQWKKMRSKRFKPLT